VAKARWKGLRDNFAKEFKKTEKPRLGEGAPPQTPRCMHFKALQFLRDVMEPVKSSGSIAFTPICNAELQESQDEEIINLRKSQEYEVESAFSEDATSEIQDPVPTAHLRAPKRTRGKSILSYQEEMISLENKKLEWLIKHEDEKDEDLSFFRSLVPYMEQLPPTKKLFLGSQFQNMVADEISALQYTLLHLQPHA